MYIIIIDIHLRDSSDKQILKKDPKLYINTRT